MELLFSVDHSPKHQLAIEALAESMLWIRTSKGMLTAES
jgi:hypothetical protein